MGKKLLSKVQAVKISKKKTSATDKKQLNCLIKVLKPKVYIIDNSNFKTLVQHLTGNNGIGDIDSQLTPTSTPSPSPPLPLSSSSSPEMVDKVPVIDVEDDDHDHHGSCHPESSMEYSSSSSLSPPSSLDQSLHNHLALTSNTNEEILLNNQGYHEYNPLPLEYYGTNLSNSIFVNQQDQEHSMDQYGDLVQSLLPDVDSCINIYNFQYQQEFEEVSIYDYELTGFI